MRQILRKKLNYHTRLNLSTMNNFKITIHETNYQCLNQFFIYKRCYHCFKILLYIRHIVINLEKAIMSQEF